ncbi:uncharacterized protein LOC128983521 [Macrosteles quadrilineatus]|uniref:uncharacterized protein LOC128983521 n=1 Tax=Macrosteles quadrilineatus TaxID=74068 RepID=UPI0023E0D624|nr:uncharacterized protein LOC128983521 [Macrosteles quadrilineatus]
MTLRLLLIIFLFQGEWWLSEAWCLYFCPKERTPETFCAVDSTRGAKLFQGRCQIWRANYCLTAGYKVMDMQQCLDRYPGVLTDYLASIKSFQKFDASKQPPSVGLWRRFFLLWTLLSRMTPRVYAAPQTALLLTLLQLLLSQKDLRSPNSPFLRSTFPQDDMFSSPNSPRTNPFSFSGPGIPRLNPLAFPGSSFFDHFLHPESPLS